MLLLDGIHFAPLRNPKKPLFVGLYRSIIIPGFLKWCRIVHPQYFDKDKKKYASLCNNMSNINISSYRRFASDCTAGEDVQYLQSELGAF